MKLQDLDFKKILQFLPDEGKVLLGNDRMLLFRQDALATLWLLLQEQLGRDLANAIVSQFGFRCGQGDYHNLNSHFKMDLPEDRLAMGPMLHTWEGIVHVAPAIIEMNLKDGKFLMKGVWSNSYEAQSYRMNYSEPSQSPVCYSLTGYASGYASAFCGFDVVAIERKCVGKGDDCCEFDIRDAKSWGDEAATWIRYLRADQGSIHRALEEKNKEFEVLNRNLEEMVRVRTHEIRQQQTRLVESARLTSIGEMAGGIAHEIKNPRY